MKLTELISKLQEIEADLRESGVDASQIDVLAGVQPSYPLTAAIVGVITGSELEDYCEDRLHDPERLAVWVATDMVTGNSPYSSYAPRPLWDAVS